MKVSGRLNRNRNNTLGITTSGSCHSNSLGTLTDISPLHLQSSILSLTSVSSSTELIPELEIKRLKDLLPRGAAEVFDIIHLLFSRENKSFNSVGRFWMTRIHFSNPDISVV